MSIKQMTKVFNDESLKGNEKLLMLALADNCNDTGVAFPSWNELIRKTSMSRGSISKWVKSLESKQLLFKKNRNRKNGSRTSSKYLIYPNENRSVLDEEDYLIFKDLYIQSSEVELPPKVQKLNYPSSEVELPNGGQSSEVIPLEPSLTSSNRQSNHHLPEWLDKKVWNEWINFRAEIKKKLTSSTIEKQLEFLSKNIDHHTDIINTSIMNGWTGLFPLKQQQKSQQQSFKEQDRQRTDDSMDNFFEARANGFDLRNIRTEEVQCEVIEQK